LNGDANGIRGTPANRNGDIDFASTTQRSGNDDIHLIEPYVLGLRSREKYLRRQSSYRHRNLRAAA
jgi:hypothetical protein